MEYSFVPLLYQYQQDLFEFFRPLVLNSNRFVLHYVWQDFYHCLATIFFSRSDTQPESLAIV